MTRTASLATLPRALFGFLLCSALFATLNMVRDPAPLRFDVRWDALHPHVAIESDEPVLPPAPPFYLHASSVAEWNRAVRCLTDAIYYEAGDEPEEGQRAVAQVVVNRLRDTHFPDSVCGVVYEGGGRSAGCQFSFVCDGSIRRRPPTAVMWDRLRPLAVQALSGYVVAEVGASTHYYADYVRPGWLASVKVVARIGRQIFCTWRGPAGLPTALTASYEGGEFKVGDAVLDGAPPRPTHAVVNRIKRRRFERLRLAARTRRESRA